MLVHSQAAKSRPWIHADMHRMQTRRSVGLYVVIGHICTSAAMTSFQRQVQIFSLTHVFTAVSSPVLWSEVFIMQLQEEEVKDMHPKDQLKLV